MQNSKPLWLIALLNLLLTCAVSAEAASSEVGIEGAVKTGQQPIEAAKVYAYEVATYALDKVQTDPEGRFLFESVPPGLYKIIAFKPGFVPAVQLLLRHREDIRQTLELALTREQSGDTRQAEDYWAVRESIPGDVLREIQQLEGRRFTHHEAGSTQLNMAQLGEGTFRAEMGASSGIEQIGTDQARRSTTRVGLRGPVGTLDVGIDGTFQKLDTGSIADGGQTLPNSEAAALSVRVDGTNQSRLSLSAARGETVTQQYGSFQPVDIEQYSLGWHGPTGDRSRSAFSANYQRESNYYNMGWISPFGLPESSQTLNFEGIHAMALSQKTSLTTGLQYRQRTLGQEFQTPGLLGDEERFGLFGLAGTQIQPRVYVEYGLFSTVNDGRLSLMPHGGMVVQLGSEWQAKTSVSRRMHSRDETVTPAFSTAQHGDPTTCRQAGEACYELSFSHSGDTEESISIGAVHREFAETLQIYFNDDFFNRLESVFVVDGDSLPELRFQLVRRITPKILARLESNIASGGGGIFYATDDQTYENQVRYLVTSIDTRFQHTSTGVFIAFHHLEQDLKPMDGEAQSAADSASAMEMQRLQLMLTQDLNLLTDVSSKWALKVNMELSRGSTPYQLTTDQELYKKLTGGISVSF